MKDKIILFVCVFLFLFSGCSQNDSVKSNQPTPPLDLNKKLTPDREVLTGTLDNGLNYIIRKNSVPQKRAAFQLLVNVGAINEEDNEQGIAHFVSRMAYNGTTHFEKKELISFLKSQDKNFHPYRYTNPGTDSTSYYFSLSSEDPRTLTKGITILKDLANEVSFHPEEVEQERTKILPYIEKPSFRFKAIMRDRGLVWKGTRYAERDGLGTKEVVQSVTPEELKKFYQRWYRPENITIVMVGDFAPKKMESAIKAQFAGIPKQTNAITQREKIAPKTNELQVSITVQPKLKSSAVVFLSREPLVPAKTVQDLKKRWVRELYRNIIKEETSEKAIRLTDFIVGDTVEYLGIFLIDNERYQESIEQYLVIMKRMSHGKISTDQFDQHKKELLRFYKKQYDQRDELSSNHYLNETYHQALYGYIYPSKTDFYHIAEQVIPTITKEDLAAVGKTLINPDRLLVSLSIQGKSQDKAPSEAELLKKIRNQLQSN